MMNITRIVLLLTFIALPMAACGVKPKSVKPPATVEEDQFPATYPAE